MPPVTDLPAAPGALRVHPHGRVLLVPLVVLLAGLAVTGYAAAALPPDAVVARAAGSVAVAGLLLRFSVLPWLRWLSTVLLVDEDGVQVRSGVLRRRRRALGLDDIAAVHVQRGLAGAGTLVVEPAGAASPLVVPRVPRVREVAGHLADLLDARR